jgi:O-methyltransferase involved in polyketide biosynthesis
MRSNQASATAKVIAAATIFLHTRWPGDALTSTRAADLCRRFLSTTTLDRVLAASAASSVLAPFWWALERGTLPGIITHYARRKLTIETRLRAALSAQSVSHVYVLGAGFDTLALRLAPEFPRVHFIEIDHPATQSVKRAALAADASYLSNLSFQSADLSTVALATLFGRDDSKRFTIAEGLLMYFHAPRVTEIVRAALLSNAGASHTMCFSYMEQHDAMPVGFRPRSRLIDLWLKLKREPFLWSASDEALNALVARAGGEIVENTPSAQFATGAKALGHDAKVLRGENLAIVQTVYPMR